MKMTSRIITAALVIIIATPAPSSAADDRADFEAVVADVVIARPLWLVATAAGTALFLATLPVSAMSRSVNKTARTLVAKPAQATFTRPPGDFSSIN